MTNEQLAELRKALKPIIKAVNVNDADTLQLASPDSDDMVIWTTSGCWSGTARVTLGDLRRLAYLGLELDERNTPPAPTGE